MGNLIVWDTLTQTQGKEMPIIRSILDQDLYKLTQQAAVLALFHNAWAHYRFINRRPEGRFTPIFLDALRDEIQSMRHLCLSVSERKHLEKWCPFLPPQYLEYLQNYRFNPQEVTVDLKDGELILDIIGPWHRTILWEVPKMAIISELYFLMIDTDWIDSEQDQKIRARDKRDQLHKAGCNNVEGGTRRRRNAFAQEVFIQESLPSPYFMGTSNVFFSKQYDCRPIGTVAHEFIQGISVLMGLRHANRFAMDAWASVYQGNLGTALSDTYGLQSFLDDFNLYHAKLWDGVRWDSGCPFDFTDRVVAHYRKLKIDPLSKFGIYSNNLNTDLAIRIHEYCRGRINCSVLIGTFFTNDFRKQSDLSQTSQSLNMVIKLVEMDKIPVVKLSEDREKVTGDPSAVKDALWTFFGTPIA